MLPSLTIEGFRAFRRLEVPRLARVNLIVGSNDVGKTSLLEALRLFAAGSTFPTVLDDIPPVFLRIGSSWPPCHWVQRASLKACYIPAHGLGEEESAELWDSVELQNEGDFLVEVMHVIAPDIERVIFDKARGGTLIAYVRRAGRRRAEPLYSLGGGARRLLDMALGLVDARGGLLLVDEVENGIHYTVQPELWALVFAAAARLDVQVFATTHSWDCIEAFQQAAAAHPATGELIRLHRSGHDIEATIADEADLAIITRQAIEVR